MTYLNFIVCRRSRSSPSVRTILHLLSREETGERTSRHRRQHGDACLRVSQTAGTGVQACCSKSGIGGERHEGCNNSRRRGC